MTFDPTKPYNDLPLLPPAVDIESKALLKACIEARAALAELKSVGALIPNQAVPVSYTHLDVYKRQGVIWKSRLRSACARPRKRCLPPSILV